MTNIYFRNLEEMKEVIRTDSYYINPFSGYCQSGENWIDDAEEEWFEGNNENYLIEVTLEDIQNAYESGHEFENEEEIADEPIVYPQPVSQKPPIETPETHIEKVEKALEHTTIPIESFELTDTKQLDTSGIAESLIDLGNPDELRRAILHYEILGKPISLRVW